MLPDFKLHYKAKVIKTVQYWHKTDIYRSVEQNKESKEKTPCLYGQSIFGKGTQNLQWGKDSFFNKQCGKTGQLHAKE